MGRTWDSPGTRRKLYVLYLCGAFAETPAGKGEARGTLCLAQGCGQQVGLPRP